MKYEVIFFDLGNTLIKFDHKISASKISKTADIPLKTVYDTFFDSKLTRLFDTGKITPHQFYKNVINLLKIELDYNEFEEIWCEIFWEDADCVEFVRSVKDKYRLFLISNTNKLHFDFILKNFDALDVFEGFILSYKVGTLKPDKKIFDYAVNLANVPREKIFYIDDREELVNAAKEQGIEGVVYRGAEELRKFI